MASGLQQLRKRAGYKTAKEFASAMDIPLTTYARYESSPEKIPLNVAWRLADAFGCAIDVIVGRKEPVLEDARGEVQLRYNALAPEFQSSLVDYLDFLTAKNADSAKRKAEAKKRQAEALSTRLESLFLAELDQSDPGFAISATTDELRAKFKGYLEKRANERQEPEVCNAVAKLMAAYDRTHRELEYGGMTVTYSIVDMTTTSKLNAKEGTMK